MSTTYFWTATATRLGIEMSDHEIQFGEVEQAGQEERLQQLRPDRNKQLAVVVCGRLTPRDLPIFVDLDALRDMEIHARSNTQVELGGVLLGGQFEDPSGRPYVVVQDSLRARHYQSSKGSFKFTHDTWSDITRRRDGFPPELQMVGWYHTHPDWGVFLSGMDLFICDHFFNRPLDVALVIDPCRGERGWFQWSDDPAERTRRTGGFYVYSSRHRQVELELFAAYLEGKDPMTHDPRTGSPVYPGAGYPVVVTSTPDASSNWLAPGVMGMLSMQFFLLVLIAWRMLLAPPGDPRADQQAELAPLLQRLSEQQIQAQRTEAQLQLVDRVVGALDAEGPQGVATLAEQYRGEADRLENDLRVYRAREQQSHRELQAAEEERATLRQRLARVDRALAESQARERQLKQDVDQLATELQLLRQPDAETDQFVRRVPPWVWIGGSVVVVMLLAGLGYAIAVSQPGRHRRLAEQQDDGDAHAQREDQMR